MKEKLLLDLNGIPYFKNSMFKSTGGGYGAYLNGDRFGFIYNVLSGISIYGGSTKTVQLDDLCTYYYFELSCADIEFLKSVSFDKLCWRNNCELWMLKKEPNIIYENIIER